MQFLCEEVTPIFVANVHIFMSLLVKTLVDTCMRKKKLFKTYLKIKIDETSIEISYNALFKSYFLSEILCVCTYVKSMLKCICQKFFVWHKCNGVRIVKTKASFFITSAQTQSGRQSLNCSVYNITRGVLSSVNHVVCKEIEINFCNERKFTFADRENSFNVIKLLNNNIVI